MTINDESQRRCSKCEKWKKLKGEFYMCQGRYRSECKVCTIRRNVTYQKQNKTWMNRSVDKELRKQYMQHYYRDNKVSFAEYRKSFLSRNPNYYKEYYENSKNSK